jgi:2-keto-4-pentenoate hydratase/2-oxohepta-3-ene-1,7-dioic acid hydratase in catechol pathway
MRLVTFETQGGYRRIGALAGSDGRIVDLNAACALYLKECENEQAYERVAEAFVPPHMRALFEGGDSSLDMARKSLQHAQTRGISIRGVRGETISYALSEVRLKAPIIPKKFFHTAGNFREHHEEAVKSGFSHPVMPWIVFFQNVDAIIGQDEPVVYPEHLTQELDYELELAVVLKKTGKHFMPEDAARHIGGYVIFNDITARDIQRREMKSGVFSFCKGIDTFCPLGPWIVTADEIPDPHNLAMELRVNGQPRQNSHSSKMSVKIPDILSHYSPMGYSAGDVVSTGTVSGVAAFSGDPKAWYLKPGDVMECEIETIGVLRNPVISWEAAYGTKPETLATQKAYR